MQWEWSDMERALYIRGEKLTPDVRTLGQMRPVLYDENADGPSELYYMYRGAHLPEDGALLKKHNVRYDITVMPAATLGGEFVKTTGHFHPKKGAHTYPEIYEVLQGEAHYLFQNEREAVVFEAKAGDKVIVPPDFGHVTINASKKTLVMSNLVSPEFSSVYGPFTEKRGAAFYELEKGWAGNPRYTGVSLSHAQPGKANCPFFTRKKTMYELFCCSPEDFSFLNPR